MINTLATLSQQIIRVVSGGDQSKDSQLDIREVSLYVGQTIEEFIKRDMLSDYKEGLKTGDPHIPSNYIATFRNLPVIVDEETAQWYVEIPSSYLSLPNNLGIYQVSGMKNIRKPFVISDSGSIGIYDGLPSSYLEGRVECYVEGLRMYFNCNARQKGITKVLMKIITGNPSNLGLNDPLPLSPSEAKEIVKEGVILFSSKGIQDKFNDNAELNARNE